MNDNYVCQTAHYISTAIVTQCHTYIPGYDSAA